MKILIFSDSHGRGDLLLRAVEREEPRLCFFLGDGERDLDTLRERYPHLPVQAVRGNCDLRSSLPLSLTCVVGGLRIFAAHGHKYDVKHDPKLWELRQAAEEEGATLALFGHTHEPCCRVREDMTLCNPGSIGAGRPPSYAVLTLENGSHTIKLRTL